MFRSCRGHRHRRDCRISTSRVLLLRISTAESFVLRFCNHNSATISQDGPFLRSARQLSASQATATSDLQTNRDSQATETEDRQVLLKCGCGLPRALSPHSFPIGVPELEPFPFAPLPSPPPRPRLPQTDRKQFERTRSERLGSRQRTPPSRRTLPTSRKPRRSLIRQSR